MDEVMELLLLEKALEGIELSEDESRFLKWICGWDPWTVDQLRQIIGKCRGTGGDGNEKYLSLNLPVAIGGTVWDIHVPDCAFTVTGYHIGRTIWVDDVETELGHKGYFSREFCIHYEGDGITCCAAVSSIGQTVFLTSEEMKAALED